MRNLKAVAAVVILSSMTLTTAFASMLAPHNPHEQHADYPYAPPLRPHLVDQHGQWRMPFVHPVRLGDRLGRTYIEDRFRTIPLLRLWRDADEPRAITPIFLLGTDALGRDVLSRFLIGAQVSLGIAAAATLGALLIGVVVGTIAGYAGGLVDELAMRLAEMVLVLPTLYVVLLLRAALPLVLEPRQVFACVAVVLTCLGWPLVARGVRAIVAVECRLGYVEAARASGASRTRLLLRHVLPAAFGFVGTQGALLMSAFAIAETTLSFAGFGFSEPTPSWGTILQEAGSVRALGEYPWLLAPAGAIALVSWAMHALVGVNRVTDWAAHH